jgi:hypothetical protein
MLDGHRRTCGVYGQSVPHIFRRLAVEEGDRGVHIQEVNIVKGQKLEVRPSRVAYSPKRVLVS